MNSLPRMRFKCLSPADVLSSARACSSSSLVSSHHHDRRRCSACSSPDCLPSRCCSWYDTGTRQGTRLLRPSKGHKSTLTQLRRYTVLHSTFLVSMRGISRPRATPSMLHAGMHSRTISLSAGGVSSPTHRLKHAC